MSNVQALNRTLCGTVCVVFHGIHTLSEHRKNFFEEKKIQVLCCKIREFSVMFPFFKFRISLNKNKFVLNSTHILLLLRHEIFQSLIKYRP